MARSILVVGLLSLPWAACAVEPPVGISAQAIIGGDASGPTDFQATGMIVSEGTLRCTATLIAPDVVLTAAHCLNGPVYGALGFTLDTDLSNGVDSAIGFKVMHQHPEFDASVDPYLDLAVRNDVGVAILDQPIADITPEEVDEPIFQTPMDNGTPFAMCGYGWEVWNSGGYARKREAMMMVDRTANFEFSTMPADPQPCNGDSGGPLFVDGPVRRRIVGLVSRAVGASSMCNTGAIVTRVAPYTDWIRQASKDRDTGCNAGAPSSLLPLCALGLMRARRRRRRPS
jgi:hypothetical protein